MVNFVGSAFEKVVVQGINNDGTPSQSSTNPGYFLHTRNVFSDQRTNNKVNFFYTGESYFQRAAEAIVKAEKSVFITGWQINYDVIVRAKDTPKTISLRAELKEVEAERKEINDRLDIAARGEQSIGTKLGGTVDSGRLNAPLIGLNAKAERLQEQIAASQQHQTLWQCLREALENNPQLKVYVLPWLSPPAPADLYTRCFETMLAIFQLNAGLEGGQRAFCIPAPQMSSQVGNGGVFFSHHQKSIVVDNKIGFVGGLDLAYGRRDDEYFDLNGADRMGDDLYNGCIPHIATPPGDQYVTTLGLLLSTFIDSSTPSRMVNAFKTVASVGTHFDNWWQVPMTGDFVLWLRDTITDIKESVNDFIDDATIAFMDMMLLLVKTAVSFSNSNLIGQIADSIRDISSTSTSLIGATVGARAVSAIGVGGLLDQRAKSQTANNSANNSTLGNTTANTARKNTPTINDGLKNISSGSRQQLQTVLDRLANSQKLTRGDYVETLPAIMEWLEKSEFGKYLAILMELPKNILPANLFENLEDTMRTTLWYIQAVAQKRALSLEKPYHYLAKVPQPLFPKGGKILNSSMQPRMPWHDVHVEIQGPSVHDLALNFVERWNTAQEWVGHANRPEDLAICKTVLSWSVSLFKQDTQNSIKGMLSWANDQLRQFQYVDELLNDLTFQNPEPNFIPLELIPSPTTIKAEQGEAATVQIIRSASNRMLTNEATRAAEEGVVIVANNQTDCLDAWLQAISAATHFLYIENQFFQSDFGREFGYNTATLSGPLSELITLNPKYKDYLTDINWQQAWDQGNASLINWKAVNRIYVTDKERFGGFFGDIWKAIKSKAMYLGIRKVFSDVSEDEERLQNPIVKALVNRITLAIHKNENFHVYLLIPVHPEGPLNSDTLINQVHLTMQTIYNGKKSLIRSIQRAIYVKKQQVEINKRIEKNNPITIDPNLEPEQRMLALNEILFQNLKMIETEVLELNQHLDEQERLDQIPDYITEDGWNKYLTLLNLRNWTVLNKIAVTEQIYIHSKLLIADDDVAIIGSCNVNDRSMLGNRDSELAAIVRGNEKKTIKIDGTRNFQVSKVVHDFRVNLWKKIFALDIPKKVGRTTNIEPATTLRAYLDKPAATATWQAIQNKANDNAQEYEKVFNFIPQNKSPVQNEVKPQSREEIYPIITETTKFYPLGCSIWPTWAYNDPDDLSKPGEKIHPMPFDPEFWTRPARILHNNRPKNIQGFITALPHEWTMGERNYNVATGMHILILAHNPYATHDGIYTVSLPDKEENNNA